VTRPTETTRLALCVLATLWARLPGSVHGQVAEGEQVVDQSIADLTPLSASLREVAPGLQDTNDFTRLTTDGDQLLRRQGALVAVFPQSVYAPTQQGALIPLIPPGTVYYVGDPFTLPAAPATGGRMDTRVDTRVDDRHAATPSHSRSSVPPLPVTVPPPDAPYDRIVADPAYRAERLRALMAYAAAQAAVGRSSSSSSSK